MQYWLWFVNLSLWGISHWDFHSAFSTMIALLTQTMIHEVRFTSVVRCMHAKLLSHVWLFVTPWTVACQASLSMGFSRQEYWSGSPCPPPGDFPDPGIEPRSPAWQMDSLTLIPPGKPSIVKYLNPNYTLISWWNETRWVCGINVIPAN